MKSPSSTPRPSGFQAADALRSPSCRARTSHGRNGPGQRLGGCYRKDAKVGPAIVKGLHRRSDGCWTNRDFTIGFRIEGSAFQTLKGRLADRLAICSVVLAALQKGFTYRPQPSDVPTISARRSRVVLIHVVLLATRSASPTDGMFNTTRLFPNQPIARVPNASRF
jgi:hypothetical protein